MSDPYRLPRTVLPHRYDLTLAPNLDTATFAGSVDIAVVVAEPTTTVVMNAIELAVDEAWVTVNGIRHEAHVSLDEPTERCTLTLTEPLLAGDATVSLRFRGLLNDKLHGFYRSTFTDDDGNERVIATTQFEATDARRAFPCWDEPDIKAVFGISLWIDGDFRAVSNGAVAEVETIEGRRRVRFTDTMIMSTYLVAFIVGPLDATEPIDVDGIPLRVLCPPGRLPLTPFALEVAEYSLRYLANYFDLPYPGDSMDLVAIPDFAFGAMENLGCVTFRETLLLVDPDHATQGELQNIVDVIAHELAHMWFGDLVTMDWWNGIWLNEAFATFMELKVTDAFRVQWERWAGFGLARSTAFDTDALHTTRPIEYPVVSPEDAAGMFDVLTYEKGAAVVRMLEQYLGEDRFRAGIRRYMTLHQYGNTETTDLWDAIEETSGEPVRRIMDSWIFQGGHPVIDVSMSDDGATVHLAQRRFTYLPHPLDASLWCVPLIIRYATADAAVHTTRALLTDETLDLALDEPATWLVVNAEGHGFFRVSYAPALRQTITAQAHAGLSNVERYCLVDDTWGSVLAGTTSAAEFLTLAEGLSDETDVAVWRRILTGVDQIERIARNGEREVLQARVRALVAPALDRSGWAPRESDGDRDHELRSVLIGAMATLGNDHEAQTRVREIFHQYLTDSQSVEANVAAAVIRVTAAFAGAGEVDAMLEGFRRSSTPQEELRLIYALAEVRDPAQMSRVLDLTMTAEVRTQNAPFVIGACLANRENGHLAWAFVQERWTEMNERFPANSIVRMLSGIRTITDPHLAKTIEAFMADHPLSQGMQTLQQHVERMRVSVGLAARLATES